MNKIDDLLNVYEPGNPNNKPDVLKQVSDIMTKRAEMEENYNKQKQQQQQAIQQIYHHIMTNPEGPVVKAEKQIIELTNENTVLKERIAYLENQLQNK